MSEKKFTRRDVLTIAGAAAGTMMAPGIIRAQSRSNAPTGWLSKSSPTQTSNKSPKMNKASAWTLCM